MKKITKFASAHHKAAYESIMGNPQVVQSLKMFSVSDEDMELRVSAYMNAMANTSYIEDIALKGGAKRRVMQFAAGDVTPGMGAANLRGTTIYPATILSYVSSIAPIFSVERFMDTPQGDLQFMDFYSLITSELILPNLGKDATFGKNMYKKDLTAQIDGTNDEFIVAVGTNVIPNTISFVYVAANKSLAAIHDDGNGVFLAPPGLLSAGSVNYKTGAISITFATAPAAGAKLTVAAAQDSPASDEVDKLMGESKYFHVTTEPIVIPIIRNIISDAAMNKQGVIDPNSLYTNLVQTTYTKLINEKVANAIIDGFDGNSYSADMSQFNLNGGFYDTFIRTFQSILVDGETLLGEQTYKGCKVSGILAGRQIANLFQYMQSGEGWIPNDQLQYFKDLIGWYKGIPVVRWDDAEKIETNELYLTHKTPDGQLAPTVRGIFLTPTDLPEIGNFKNPTQMTNGMFSLEGVRPTTSKLVVKLKITLPESQFLTKLVAG